MYVPFMPSGPRPTNQQQNPGSDNEERSEAGEDEELLRSRTSLKKERVNNEKALANLVRDLLALNEEKWEALGVSELTIDKLLDAKKIKSHAARGRQLRLVRSTLRDGDWALIRRGMDRMKAGLSVGTPTEPSAAETETVNWTEQLMVQGDPGLARFVAEYPNADRKRLRQLVRNVKMAPDNKRGKARVQLERAVAQEVGSEE